MSKLLLSFCQFSSSWKVDAKEGHDRVDDQQLEDVRLLVELGSHEVKEFHLLLRGVGASVEHVVENRLLFKKMFNIKSCKLQELKFQNVEDVFAKSLK